MGPTGFEPATLGFLFREFLSRSFLFKKGSIKSPMLYQTELQAHALLILHSAELKLIYKLFISELIESYRNTASKNPIITSAITINPIIAVGLLSKGFVISNFCSTFKL